MEEKQNIGIIGQGFVGNSVKEGLKDYYNIFTYDVKPELSGCKSLREVVTNCDIIFVCLPTPMSKDGSCHVDILKKAIADIYDISFGSILIIKSTLPPTTINRFVERYGEIIDFVYNPEFLTEANAVNDFKNQDRIILGCEDYNVFNTIATIYRKAFPLVPIIQTTFDEAIMVKYITNAFLSTKVIFANEFYDLCRALNIDYGEVSSIARLDTRLGKSHWSVPGPDGDRGYGGHCFPKDLGAIRFVGKINNVNTDLMDVVIAKNDKIRKNRDWETQKGRAVI